MEETKITEDELNCYKTYQVMESEQDIFLEMLSKEIEVDGNIYKYVDYTAEGGNTSETIDINTTKTILSKTNNKYKIIEQLENTIKYEKDGYIGEYILNPNTLKIKTNYNGFREDLIEETINYTNLEKNDLDFIPKQTIKNGLTLDLLNVEWEVESTKMIGKYEVANIYTAKCYYATKQRVDYPNTYTVTAEYFGTATKTEEHQITYVVKYEKEEPEVVEEKQDNNVFLQSLSSEKIFFVMKNLEAILVNKTYKIPLVIYLPQSYPNSPPEFYILKKPKIGINIHYNKNDYIIDNNSFRIYTDKICAFNPSKNNLDEIIEALKKKFSKDFPIFQDKNSANNQMLPFSPANPDLRKANQVIVESNKMTNKQALNLAKQQTRDIVLKKYQEFKNKYKVTENYYELNTINNIVKLKAGNNANGNENPMIDSLNYLKGIKQKLIDIENGLNQEMQNCGSQKKTPLEKCDDLIKIKDDEDMRLLMMKKAIEDYLVCLKKGFERRVVSFQDMVNQTRELSREIFSIDYLRTQRKNSNYF